MAQLPSDNPVTLGDNLLAPNSDSIRELCTVCDNKLKLDWQFSANPLTLVQDENASKDGETTISQFLQRESRFPNMTPCRNLILKNWNMRKGHGLDQDTNVHFWLLYGKRISVLTLNGVEIDFAIENPLEFILEKLPILEKLTLQNCKLSASGPCRMNTKNRKNARRQAQPPRQPLAQTYVYIEEYLEERHQEAPVQNEKSSRSLTHKKLTFICFENVETSHQAGDMLWKYLLGASLDVEKISIKASEKIATALFGQCRGKYFPKLRELDIINAGNSAYGWCPNQISNYNWNKLSLKKLTLDGGFKTDSETVEEILNGQSNTLETLHLYRAPLSSAYVYFPCKFEMVKLTELCLWGNVATNLNFLMGTPNLKVFKWNTTCYNKDNQGARLHAHLTPSVRPEVVNKIVKNTNDLGAAFVLEKLITLEIKWGPTSVESLKKLGSWMPNLKKVKVVVSGDDQIALILKQWRYISSLQLAHGSSLSTKGMLEFIRHNKSWLKLDTFTWKPCPCVQTCPENKHAESNLTRELQQVTNTVVLPWRQTRVRRRPPPDQPCFQNLFENAVAKGDEDISIFLKTLKAASLL